MNKLFLISISFLILLISINCNAAADLDVQFVDSWGLGPNDHVFAIADDNIGPQYLGQQQPPSYDPVA